MILNLLELNILISNIHTNTIIMSKKYIELKKDRVAILDYHFGIDENSETFKELKEDEIIPVDI